MWGKKIKLNQWNLKFRIKPQMFLAMIMVNQELIINCSFYSHVRTDINNGKTEND